MSWLIEKIESHSTREAIVAAGGVHTYGDLAEQIRHFREQLAPENLRGKTVVLLSDYNFYSIALFMALMAEKVIVVPLVPDNDEETSNKIESCHCDVLLQLNSDQVELETRDNSTVHELAKDLQQQEAAGLILFSSGSTGNPKAMLHDLDNFVLQFKTRKSKTLTILVFLMFDHIGGLNTLINALVMGAKIVVPESRDTGVIASLIEKHRVQLLPASPTFLNLMLIAKVADKHDLSSVKLITYGTEPMPQSLLERVRTAFPRCRLLQTFGTSETGIAQTVSRNSGSLEMKLNDPNLEYRIVEGELWLRSKTQVKGYLNASMERFTEDGWFKTGDLVETISDGYLRIVGRNKEVINVGGEKVIPSEIESVILEVDGVLDAMVFGRENALTGQMVAAELVIAADRSEKEMKSAIRSHCRAKLENYKVPVKFIFTEKTHFNERFKKIRRF